ncbi:BamA/TamA family outer membrane protein, partial [Escherichia coli]|nr:BamA/TamA family outer membrane protein [Escherichia coli]
FQYVGADTQLLGNFEYRIPLFGPVSLAAFADIGSAFNLRKGRDQFITSNFLADTPFLPGTLGVSLTSLAATQNPNLA